MKYIDSEKLIAEIDNKLLHEQGFEDGNSEYGYKCALKDIKRAITSLQQEQPEVDLEKELEQWRHEHFKGKRDEYYSGEYLERESQLDIARHFYELGLNARKG